MTHWVRLWEDMPDDPKWRVVAKRSGRPLHQVIAVFTRMLVNAGRSSQRGSLEGWDDEDEAMALDMDEADVAAIREAMQGKVLEGNALTGWDKRQPKRERDDDLSSERVRAFRERKRNETPCNATERLDKIREDKIVTVPDGTVVDGEPPTPPAEPLAEPIERKKVEGREQLKELGTRWNAFAAELGLSQIEEIKPGSARERSALARIREGCDFDRVFAKIRGSPFLRGDKGSTPASFDWITNPTNYLKIIEGNYDEIRQTKPAAWSGTRQYGH